MIGYYCTVRQLYVVLFPVSTLTRSLTKCFAYYKQSKQDCENAWLMRLTTKQNMIYYANYPYSINA